MRPHRDFEDEHDELNNRPLMIGAFIAIALCLWAAWIHGQL